MDSELDDDQRLAKTNAKSQLAKAMFNFSAAKSWKALRKLKNLPDPYPCSSCKKFFCSRESRSLHQKFCTSKADELGGTQDKDKDMEEQQDIILKEKRLAAANYTCYACGVKFCNEQEYFRHMGRFRYTCQACECHFLENRARKLHYCLGFLNNL